LYVLFGEAAFLQERLQFGVYVLGHYPGAFRIRVNAVCPGFIDTAMIDQSAAKSGNDMKAALAEMEPVGRMGTGEEVAEAVIYLASDGAAFTTGIGLLVDGGWVAR